MKHNIKMPRSMGREKTPYFHLEEDAAQERGVRAALGHHGVSASWCPISSNVIMALGLIHSQLSPCVPGRFKDYISTPKPNGYRSIHTTVIGPASQRIEVQIAPMKCTKKPIWGWLRTGRTKQGKKPSLTEESSTKYRWLRELLEFSSRTNKPEDFWKIPSLSCSRIRFMFSPKGAI
jgi:(p)ppGpp synthase/HD superfamily hydrolase